MILAQLRCRFFARLRLSLPDRHCRQLLCRQCCRLLDRKNCRLCGLRVSFRAAGFMRALFLSTTIFLEEFFLKLTILVQVWDPAEFSPRRRPSISLPAQIAGFLATFGFLLLAFEGLYFFWALLCHFSTGNVLLIVFIIKFFVINYSSLVFIWNIVGKHLVALFFAKNFEIFRQEVDIELFFVLA